MKKVYIETTIPSFYYETRKSSDMQSRRNWTRDWWNNYSKSYEIYSSEAVLDELESGKPESVNEIPDSLFCWHLL